MLDRRQFVPVKRLVYRHRGAGADISRGRQLLLNRGIQIQAQELLPTFDFDVDRWQSANFTTINFQSDGPLHPILLARMPTDQQWGRGDFGGSPVLTSAELPYASNCVSLQSGDEMSNIMSILPTVAAQFSTWNSLYPNTLAFTNFYGSQLNAGN